MSLFEGLSRVSGVFYTQSVDLYAAVTKKTSSGDRYAAPGESLGTLSCNVQPTTREAAQRQYGMEIVEGWRLSCAPDERVQPGVFVVRGGGTYRVRAALHHPSHTSALIAREDMPDEN